MIPKLEERGYPRHYTTPWLAAQLSSSLIPPVYQ
jgi:hypothetical protein